MAGKIFINYRREDARADARNIRDRLAGAFGASHVFMDVDNLQPGQRFDQELAKALAQCDVFLAVIGPRWQAVLQERAEMGVHDYVREEIAAALANGMAVIPVLIERTPMPPADGLPPDMRALVMHQKHGIEHERFGRDVGELIAAVRAILKTRRRGGAQSTWLRTAARVLGLIVGAYMAVQLLLLIVGAFIFTVHRDGRTEPAPPPAVAERPSPVKDAAATPEAKEDPAAEARRQADEREAKQQAELAEREARRLAAIETHKTRREPIPAELPVDPQVLRVVETNPAFANAPPVMAVAYHLAKAHRWVPADGMTTQDIAHRISVRPLRPGLVRLDEVKTFPIPGGKTVRHTSNNIFAANGLINISARSFEPTDPITTRATSISSVKGRVFPVEIGNRFSYVATYRSHSNEALLGDFTSDSTLTRSCGVTKKYDARSFHPELTGAAYLAECDESSSHTVSSTTTSVDPFSSKSKQATVFFEALGIWIDADRTSPKETFVRRTQLSNEKKTSSSTSILKTVELLP